MGVFLPSLGWWGGEVELGWRLVFLALLPWFALVCRVVLCYVLLCCAVPFRTVLCCALLSCGVPCRVPSCCALLCCGRLFFAVLRRAALCCAVPCCGVMWGAVLQCGVVFCVVSCCAVLCRALLCSGSAVPLNQRGVVLALVRLVALLCGSLAPVMRPVGGWWAWLGVEWLAGSVLRGSERAVRSGGSAGCPWCCPPLVPCPLWVPVPRGAPESVGWGAVACSALLVPLPSVLLASVSSPDDGAAAACPFPPVPVPLCPCGGPCGGKWPGWSPGG